MKLSGQMATMFVLYSSQVFVVFLIINFYFYWSDKICCGFVGFGFGSVTDASYALFFPHIFASPFVLGGRYFYFIFIFVCVW